MCELTAGWKLLTGRITNCSHTGSTWLLCVRSTTGAVLSRFCLKGDGVGTNSMFIVIPSALFFFFLCDRAVIAFEPAGGEGWTS